MTLRNANQGQGGNCPSRALLAAVVLQAVDDLTASDETVRWEAHEFFLQPRGGWAEMRRFYFDALGLDEGKVLASLAPRLSAPERPEKKWTADDLLALLPKEQFAARAMMRQTRCGYSQVRGWLETLKMRGLVVQTGRGQFCRADCYTLPPKLLPRPPPAPPTAKPKPDARRIILESLLDGPKTIREINFALNGAIGTDVIRTHLKLAVEECVVDYDIPFWSLRKIAA
jgi:hypothetical protein